MRYEEQVPTELDSAALIRNLLDLEPTDVAESGPVVERNALAGLGMLMRRALESAIECSSRPTLTIRLGADGTRAEHLTTFLVWAFVQSRRRRSGLPFAPLAANRKDDTDAPIHVAERLHGMSIEGLIAEIAEPVAVEPGLRCDIVDEAESYPVSIAATIRSVFRLEPSELFAYRTGDRGIGPKDPEARARIGLEFLVLDVLAQYGVMRERGTSVIRLMSADDAADAKMPERAAHIAALLAGALLVDERHGVSFLPPRVRSTEDKAILRETAKLVYRDYSDEAMRGFELLCDGIVHFGHGYEPSLAERLLCEVADEIDPDLQQVPYSVAVQRAIASLDA